MGSEALIRFACAPIAGVKDMAFNYLEAICNAGLAVRVMPLGICPIFEPPWNSVSEVFVSALATRYINVVCVKAGLPVGTPPIEAIPGLFIIGIPNVAIVDGKEEFSDKELEALRLYTTVICTDLVGKKTLGASNVRAIFIQPESDQLSRLFSGMTPV